MYIRTLDKFVQYQCLSSAVESIVSPCVAERAKDGCDDTAVLVTVTNIEMQIVYKIILRILTKGRHECKKYWCAGCQDNRRQHICV